MTLHYRPEIDGLRAIAVLPVIFFHAGFSGFGGGFVGVDVFFVISGYLITSIILREKDAGTFSIIRFYERRMRRILPALFFVLICTLPFAWAWLWPDRMDHYARSLIAVTLFVSNFFFFLNSEYFDIATEEMPLIHTWSLAVEEQFYLLFPMFIVLAWRFGKRFIVLTLCLVALVSLGLAQFGGNLQFSPPYLEENLSFTSVPTWGFYLAPTRAWELMAGALTAFYLHGRLADPRPVTGVAAGVGLIGIAMILAAVAGYDSTTPFPSLYTLLPVIGTALIVVYAGPGNAPGRILASAPMVRIGLISYSAYLWHVPIFALARMNLLQEPGVLVFAGLTALTLGLAYLTWRFVEQPFRTRSRIPAGTVVTGAVVGSLLFVGIGYYGHANNGLPDRFGPEFAAVGDQLREEKKAIRRLSDANDCYFTGQGRHKTLRGFLTNWPCEGAQESGKGGGVRLVIVGDSHAADKSMALQLNGLRPLEMTGGGCSLVPDLMGERCRQQFEHLREWMKSRPGDYRLVLNNRFQKNEVTKDAVVRMIDYWRTFSSRLVYVSSMPEFRALELQLVRGAYVADKANARRSVSEPVTGALAAANIPVINIADLFCSLAPGCAPVTPKNELLIVDYAHLSKIGARRLGKLLLEKLQALDK